MDLDEQELYWTRKRNGLAGEEETERYIRSLEKRIYNLEQIEKEHQKQNGELQKKIKELENADLTTVYMNGFYDGEKKWKDKIKEKIKEFREVRDEILKNEKQLQRESITYDLKRNDYCEKMLQELLEERN